MEKVEKNGSYSTMNKGKFTIFGVQIHLVELG